MIEKFTAVIVEAREDIIIDDNSERCEDCPDINPNPPSSSDCQFFDMRPDGPVCMREDGFQAEISNLLIRRGPA